MAQRRAVVAEVPLTWVDVDKVPIQFVNSCLTQIDDFGDLIVAFGQTTPPALTSTDPEENRKQVERIAYVPVRPIVRLHMSRDRLQQFIGFLESGLKMQEQYRALKEQVGDQG